MMASLCVTSCVVSLLSVGCISVNRYVFICHHQQYASMFTRPKCYVIIACVWLIGLALDFPSHVGWSVHAFDRKTQKCLWDRTAAHSYTVFFVSAGMLLPLTVIVVCYCRIFVHIRRAKHRILALKQSGSGGLSATQAAIVKTIRQVKMIFAIFVAFSVCWTPYIVVLLTDVWDTMPLSVHLHASMFAHLHASVNFILYGLANKSLRAGYREFITRKLCCAAFCRHLPVAVGGGASLHGTSGIDDEAAFYGSVNRSPMNESAVSAAKKDLVGPAYTGVRGPTSSSSSSTATATKTPMSKADDGEANSSVVARQVFVAGSAGDDIKTSIEMTSSNGMCFNQRQQP
jgi:hypothetical protein